MWRMLTIGCCCMDVMCVRAVHPIAQNVTLPTSAPRLWRGASLTLNGFCLDAQALSLMFFCLMLHGFCLDAQAFCSALNPNKS